MNAVFLEQELRRFLLEDLGHAEVDTQTDPQARVEAEVIAEANGIMCGGDLMVRLLELLARRREHVGVQYLCGDGAKIFPKKTLAKFNIHPEILRHGIRTGLNLVQHLSGIALNAAAYVEAVAATGCTILDTRKTTPGFRAFEKYAVRVGGARNHRFNRLDGIILKKEDLLIDGGIAEAVRKAALAASHLTGIEVEVESFEQLSEAIEIPAVTHVLLDNMSVDMVREAVIRTAGRKILEASGIDPAKLRPYADTGVPFISTSALIREARPVKMKMRIVSA